MKFNHLLTAASLGVAVSLSFAAPAASQGNSPANIGDLPPGLQDKVRSLPPTARGRALGLLGSMPFEDFAHVRVGDQGYVAYIDPAPENAEAFEDEIVPPSGILAADVFSLHSKPGAADILYLDFNGHTLEGTLWNTNYFGTLVTPIVIGPWDPSNDGPSFSQNEVDRIAEAWKRVSEDFAPFDVDVTTEDPGFLAVSRSTSNPRDYGPNVGHALITTGSNPVSDSCGCGGVAYLRNWGSVSGQTTLNFNSSLGTNAMTISHETGHSLGLSHDGGGGDGSYYRGHGSGATGWGPIMGAPFGYSVVTWDNGSYPNANNLQDDYSIMDNYIAFRPDDHADVSLAAATPLVAAGGTTVTSTGRVTDPSRLLIDNEGIIGSQNDVDLFSMNISAGLIDIDIRNDLVETFAGSQGADLDLEVKLLDEFGSVLQTSNPGSTLDASINWTATVAGTYYLEITGVGIPFTLGTDGNATAGYDDYGVIGHYFISGTIPPDVVVTNPPVAVTGLTETLVGDNNIQLDWTDPNSGTSSESGYRVHRSTNGGASFSLYASLPANSTSFDDNNLATGEYMYRIESWNSVESGVFSDDTLNIVIDVPTFAVATSESTSLGSVQSGSYVSTQQASGAETLSEQHSGGRPNRRQSYLDHTWFVTGVVPGSVVTLEVDASAPANSEGDDFYFSYSLNGGATWDPIGADAEEATIVNGSGAKLSAMLPGSTAGTVLVRVEDTDQTTQGSGSTDTVTISQITVTSSGDPGEQAPMIQITSPANGSVYASADNIVLEAEATDAEDGPISGKIAWTVDPGGSFGTGASKVVTGWAAGDYSIVATVEDSAFQSVSDSIMITIDNTPPPADMHVGDLDISSAPAGKGGKWSAQVTITVHGQIDGPVANATVSGSWSGGANGSNSCTTNGSGVCTISKGGLKNNASSATFTVTGVSGSLAYDPGANHDPDGESDGTTITVSAP